jgi:two-component system chemotaxis sensor kinase CheA
MAVFAGGPMIEDKDLLKEYLSESEEFLDRLIADLDLMASRAGGEQDINLVNRIFRTIHSLKGLSGMMGFIEIQTLAHEFEDILDDLRMGQLRLDRDAAIKLQEAGAGFASLLVGATRATATEEDYDRMRELLSSVARGARERSRREFSATDVIGLTEKERALLTEYEQQRVKENYAARRSFYFISVQFEAGRLESQYRSLSSLLAEQGELITTLPSAPSDQSKVAFKLLFATGAKESDLKRAVAPFAAQVLRAGRSPWRKAGEALSVVVRNPLRPKKQTEDRSAASPIKLPLSIGQDALRPISPSVRVDLQQIDDLSSLAHELSIQAQSLASMADSFLKAAGLGPKETHDLKFSARRMERDFVEMEERLVELRMVSLAQTFTRAARVVGRLAREIGKSISVELSGRETQLDKMIVDRIADPIYHILTNAIDHGVEMPDDRRLAGKSARGKIKIEAALDGTRAVISISDDGQGIDPAMVRRRAAEIGAMGPDEDLSDEEVLRLIFYPGFSTASEVSPLSGRGVGLDAVERTIHELGGEIRVSSTPGIGSRFDLVVPTTLVLISAFIVRVSRWSYAVNVGQIVELAYVSPREVMGRDGRRSVKWRDTEIRLIELAYVLGLGGARVLHAVEASENGSPSRRYLPVLIARVGEKHVAVAVDEFFDQREIVVKSFGPLARTIKGVSGAVDLEGGDVALVLDLPNLLMQRSMGI